MDAFNGVGGIHDFANGAAIVKELLDMMKIPHPHINSSWISGPLLFEGSKGTLVSLQTWRTVYLS